MNAADERDLFVCYVPGLDLRRLPGEDAPHITSLMEAFPWSRIRTLPDTELLPTLLTGTFPHEHGVWQVRLRAAPDAAASLSDRLVRLLPDLASTTWQGIVHLATGRVDLATIPARRRRRFALHRFKYERREDAWVEPSDRVPSIFSLLAPGRSRYHFCRHFSRLDDVLERLPSAGLSLEFFELYAFDMTEHWNLDRPGVMREALRRVDDAVAILHERCLASGRRFVLLSDHGQEPVRETIDLVAVLRDAGVPESEFDYYIQVPSARFWFHTRRARAVLLEALAALERCTLWDYRELRRFGIEFRTPEFGEAYLFADPGWVFFPHDFHQPLANLFLGATDPQQRPRIREPVQRGCHGYLPDHDSEVGFVLLADEAWETRVPWIELVDVAPTLLRLAGGDPAPSPRGRPAFRRRAISSPGCDPRPGRTSSSA